MIEKKSPPRASTRKSAQPAAKSGLKKVVPTAVGTEKAEPIVPPAKPTKEKKPKKQKMVRDSFTMPQDDYAHIAALKERCLKAGLATKKSEVLRASLACLSGLSDDNLVKAIRALDIIKTGRPAKA